MTGRLARGRATAQREPDAHDAAGAAGPPHATPRTTQVHMTHPLSRQTVGILGPIGALLLVVWAVGFLAFGVHGRGWHVLVPVGIVLIIAQAVLRVNSGSDDPD